MGQGKRVRLTTTCLYICGAGSFLGVRWEPALLAKESEAKEVVPGGRRRERLAAEARCKRIRHAVKPFVVGPCRRPTAPLGGARRDGAVAQSVAYRGTRVVTNGN